MCYESLKRVFALRAKKGARIARLTTISCPFFKEPAQGYYIALCRKENFNR